MAYNMLSNMAGIRSKFSRVSIVAALEQFRDLHREEYKDALDVFREDVVKELTKLRDKAVHEIVTEFDVPLNLGLKAPVDCEKEYNQLIKLFLAVTQQEVELGFDEANRIFNNEWDWALAAYVSNNFYSSRKVSVR